MPLGNGAPRGLPSMPLGIYSDPRTYDTVHSAAGDTGFAPVTRPSLGMQMSPYEKVVAATPGLAAWWPLCSKATVWGVGQGYGNACGGATLKNLGAGTDTVVPGIVPGSKNNAVKLNGAAYLVAGDYRVWPQQWETLMTTECWVNFSTLNADVCLMGEWDNTANGWMVFVASGDLRMYCGGNNITLSTFLTTGKTYHIVCVFGGSGTPTADYVSRAYVNGVDVLHSNLSLAAGTDTTTKNAHFQINSYGNTDGGHTQNNMTIQHVALYQRMLQPNEVKQHYQAGFARG